VWNQAPPLLAVQVWIPCVRPKRGLRVAKGVQLMAISFCPSIETGSSGRYHIPPQFRLLWSGPGAGLHLKKMDGVDRKIVAYRPTRPWRSEIDKGCGQRTEERRLLPRRLRASTYATTAVPPFRHDSEQDAVWVKRNGRGFSRRPSGATRRRCLARRICVAGLPIPAIRAVSAQSCTQPLRSTFMNPPLWLPPLCPRSRLARPPRRTHDIPHLH